MSKKVFLILVAVTTVHLALYFVVKQLSAGNGLIEAEFQMIDGKKTSLENYRGKPVLVIFWATTCRVCIEEIPHLKSFFKKWQPKGLEMIAVAMPYDPPSAVLIYVKKQALPYQVAIDVQGKTLAAFPNVTVTPSGFLIGTDGKILWKGVGQIPFTHLESLLGSINNKGNDNVMG